MSPDEKFGRRVIGAFSLGVSVALVNSIIDVFFKRLGVPTASTFLNDLIIGAAAGLFAYFWMSRQNAKNELEFSTQMRMEEAVHLDRKRIALELHDTVCQAQTGAIMHLECADDSLGANPEAREQVTRALQLVRMSMSEMRCALWDLYPEELQKQILKSAIEIPSQGFDFGQRITRQVFLRRDHSPASSRNRKRVAANQPGSRIERRKTRAGA